MGTTGRGSLGRKRLPFHRMEVRGQLLPHCPPSQRPKKSSLRRRHKTSAIGQRSVRETLALPRKWVEIWTGRRPKTQRGPFPEADVKRVGKDHGLSGFPRGGNHVLTPTISWISANSASPWRLLRRTTSGATTHRWAGRQATYFWALPPV